ncbi:hypothetical protein ACFL59_12760 [Planctomycetota bacterium]
MILLVVVAFLVMSNVARRAQKARTGRAVTVTTRTGEVVSGVLLQIDQRGAVVRRADGSETCVPVVEIGEVRY